MASTSCVQYVLAAAGVGTTASHLQKAISRLSSRRLLVLWEEDQIGHGRTRGQLPPGTRAAMALPGVVVYHMERYATRLYGPLGYGTCSAGIRENRENLGKWFPPWTVKHQMWSDALNPRISGVATDVLLFSECGHPLVDHYRVFTKGISHVSLRGSYLDNLRTFITQSEAVDRWGQDKDTAHLSPGHRGSAFPRSIQKWDSDEESSCCKARRARCPRKLNVVCFKLGRFRRGVRSRQSCLSSRVPWIWI